MKAIYGLGAGLVHALLSGMPEFDMVPLHALSQAPSSGVKNHHRRIRTSKYWPHQGKRECARRLTQPAVIRALAAVA